MRVRLGIAALLFSLLPFDGVAQAVIEANGAAELGVALRRLGTTKRVLMVAAHPDDENTALIAELALGEGADVAYLSLTRGEGGQNLIGPELQEGLGLIRSEELLAARRLDGAQQFFTRAYDYGFSKSADEAFTQWPKDSLLADVVEVVRRYRPDIVVSVFSGTPADGHGQHQAAGILAYEAFTAASDSTRFPGQIMRGLRAHAPAYLFQSLWRPPADPPIALETGDYDPLFGRSRYQIAMQSRSRHRSQDMGMAQPPGSQPTALRVMAGDHPVGAQSLFAGLDTTLAQHARTAGAAANVIAELAAYERDIGFVRSTLNPLAGSSVPDQLISALRSLDTTLLLLDSARYDDLRFRVTTERQQAADAVLLAAGVVVDATADTPTPVAGTTFQLTATVWNGGVDSVSLRDVQPVLPEGWRFREETAAAVMVPPGTVTRATWRVAVPATAERREPYFLSNVRADAMYSWRGVADSLRTLPFRPADIGARLTVEHDVDIHVARGAAHVAVDKAFGEIRRPLIVVPAAAVAVDPAVAAIPAGDPSPRSIAVTVSTARDDMNGVLRLDVPSGWSVSPDAYDVSFERAGASRTFSFAVNPPANASGEHVLSARFESGGRTYDEGYTLIDYPHINPHPLYRSADVRAMVFPVAIARDLTIGYIEGAGDDGAQVLRQLGATVELLDGAALAGNLSRYNAVVAGIRAYEVRPDLIAHNDRVLDYVRGGGTFIVQYNKYELVDGGFMPFPATMSRPHGRVTDEQADVTIIDRDHPIMLAPNRITPADFDGWVQERGLYFLESFDERYDALLSMADPGEAPQTGSLVAARVGDGWYVYTGLALFRQLPEAVPGAYRLLANLVSLGTGALMP